MDDHDALLQVEDLIKTGEAFTFATFSTKNERGYPRALAPTWLIWTHDVQEFLKSIRTITPVVKSIKSGLGIMLIGQGEPDFFQAKDMILNGLHASRDVLRRSQAPRSSPITMRIDATVEPPAEAAGAHEKMLNDVAALEDTLAKLPPPPAAGIGHNNPPSPIDDYPVNEIAELKADIGELKTLPAVPKEPPKRARQIAERVGTLATKVAQYVAKQADNFVTEGVKTGGRAAPIWAMFGDQLTNLGQSIVHWLSLLPH